MEVAMRKIALLALGLGIGFGAGLLVNLNAQVPASTERPGMTGLEIHKKADTKNLPVAEPVDPF